MTDIHAAVAKLMYGTDKVSPFQRKEAKMALYRSLYCRPGLLLKTNSECKIETNKESL